MMHAKLYGAKVGVHNSHPSVYVLALPRNGSWVSLLSSVLEDCTCWLLGHRCSILLLETLFWRFFLAEFNFFKTLFSDCNRAHIFITETGRGVAKDLIHHVFIFLASVHAPIILGSLAQACVKVVLGKVVFISRLVSMGTLSWHQSKEWSQSIML